MSLYLLVVEVGQLVSTASVWASPVQMVVRRPLVTVDCSPSSVLVARLLLVAAKLAMSGGVVREHDLSWALPLYLYVLSLSCRARQTLTSLNKQMEQTFV